MSELKTHNSELDNGVYFYQILSHTFDYMVIFELNKDTSFN